MSRLLVPVTVEAFTADQYNEKEKWICDELPDFEALPDTILGDQVEKAPFSFAKPLKPGIHLHFILPDALTHGTERDGTVEYPDIPDRWLVIRLVKRDGDGGWRATSWMVESDYIGQARTDVPVPALDDPEHPYQYLGRCYPLEEKPQEGAYLGGIKAFGSGDPAFAAYYPNCRGVLGFHDPLEGIADGVLTYFVAGWYGSGREPLDKMEIGQWRAKMEEFLWAVSGGGEPETGKDGKVSCSVLCHGMVCNIGWKGPDFRYETGIPKGHINVTIADTSQEALSALLASGREDAQDMEFLLNALQSDCVDLLDEIDGVQKINDAVHAGRFAYDRRGTQWELTAEKAQDPLPDGTRLLYRKLTGRQEEKNRWLRQKISLQQRLYDVWHTYLLLYENPYFSSRAEEPAREEIADVFWSLYGNLEQEQKKGEELDRAIAAAKEELEEALAGLEGEYRVENVPEEGYAQCNSPVMLFSGDGLRRGFVYGEDGRFDARNRLLCRLEGDVVRSLSVPLGTGTVVLDSSALSVRIVGTQIPQTMTGLVYESVLLDISSARALAVTAFQLSGEAYSEEDVEKLSEEIRKLQIQPWEKLLHPGAQKADASAFDGTLPSKVSVNFYEPTMNSLFLEWKVSYTPTRPRGGADAPLDGWSFQGQDYVYKAASTGKATLFTGRTVVTPHSQRILKQRLEKQAERCTDEELKRKLLQAARQLENLCLLSQSLDGFSPMLTARRPGMQLPFMITNENLRGDETALAMTEAARRCLADLAAANPMDSEAFFPVRAGYLKVEEMQLVGSFGQRQVITAEFDTVSAAAHLKPPDTVRADAELKPRAAQGGRFDFEWLGAADDVASPVCGFVIPDWLNRGLMVYDAAGERLGTAQLVWRGKNTYCRWHPAPSADNSGNAPEFENKHLQGFVRALLDSGENVFAGFLEYIDKRQSVTLPEDVSHSGDLPLLNGRPLTLLRAGMSMSLNGLPDYCKSLDKFGQFEPGEIGEAEFTVVIGDGSRTHEGCIGYFAAQTEDELYKTMYICGGAGELVPAGNPYLDAKSVLRLRHDAEPTQITLLAEAGSPITLYTGAYPVRSARLPEEFYREAYGRMHRSFAIYPILGMTDSIRIPLAEDANSKWAFLYPDAEGGYSEVFPIRPDIAAFTEGKLRILDGYLMEKEVAVIHES